MARNIEIKARVADRATLVDRVEAVAGPAVAELRQDDTFFHCGHGRLKLRDFGDATGELIAYARPDTTEPSLCDYERSPTDDPAALRATLTRALGELARVVKARWLYQAGRTRIHIDRVAGLGDYMELEVVLADGDTLADGQAEAKSLMRELAIDPADLCAMAYVDMLLAEPSAVGRHGSAG
ncbi:class IV adenylate cyclase [Salinisphaera sp. SPP-AMP-43]|uniref:class IV adenylate cyclase n=1 Tax=Salinisphaera sp. SPP-AMP-43 TaxID=3121288 RepID=UPI003C6E8558